MLLQALHRDRQQRLELWQVRWFIISIFMVLSQVPEFFMGCLCFRYMNSQECLVGPGTDFLADYKLLLRADLDTFPTPRFRGLWPEGVLVDRNYQTNFGLRRWFTQEWEFFSFRYFIDILCQKVWTWNLYKLILEVLTILQCWYRILDSLCVVIHELSLTLLGFTSPVLLINKNPRYVMNGTWPMQ